MVRIRLARRGSKKNPFYHIIVADSRNARNSRFIERVGFYDPLNSYKDKKLFIHSDRVEYWIQKGAQPSKLVFILMKKIKRYA